MIICKRCGKSSNYDNQGLCYGCSSDLSKKGKLSDFYTKYGAQYIHLDGSDFILDKEKSGFKLWFEDTRDYKKKHMGMWIITDIKTGEIIDRGYSVVSHARYILEEIVGG